MVTTEVPAAGFRPARARAMTIAGVAILVVAVVHTVWTGFHAPLAAWIAPLGMALVGAGLWSWATGRRLPRWATGVLWLMTIVLMALLAWTAVYALTHPPVPV